MNQRERKFLTVAAAAKQLGVDPKTVYRWCWSGELHHHKLGRSTRIADEDLIAFLGARRK